MNRCSLFIGLTLFWLLSWTSTALAVTVHISDDTDVNLAQTSHNYGATETIIVRNVGTGGDRHGFVQFDFSALPADVEISQATLRLCLAKVTAPGLWISTWSKTPGRKARSPRA